MKHFKTGSHRSFFEVLASTRDAQVATMILRPGQSSSDEPENEHPENEQWLYVISGSGRAVVKGRRIALKPGSLLLIAKGEPHQIKNTGRHAMSTLNFYAPPAYTEAGELRE